MATFLSFWPIGPASSWYRLTQLTRKHSGELVAADQTRDYWRLVKAAPGFSEANWDEQFWCFENGQEIPGNWGADTCQEAFEQWAPFVPGQDRVQKLMDEDIKAQCNDSAWEEAQLQPAWEKMRFRHVCPCQDNNNFAWVRHGTVLSVGELFMLLGREYTAAQIYTLYRCMRIAVVKSRKHKSGGHSSLGSAVAGLAAGRVMRLHEDWKQLRIEEYSTLQGQDVPSDSTSAWHNVFKAAVQYAHVNLLQDLSPPWIDHHFPQALTGDGVLAR